MSFIGFHGDPCARCPHARPGQPVRAAVHHGCCMPCWLGATERQRDNALLDELMTAPDRDPLEDLYALPAVEPGPQQFGEEDIAA